MQLEDYFTFVGADAQHPWDSQSIRLKGHRINIEHILNYYHAGYNPDEIAAEFPGLTLEKVHATITFYLHFQNEVNAYLATQQQNNEKAYALWAESSPAIVQRLKEAQTTYNHHTQK